MKIRPFGIEIWMNRHENACELNLAETCVESLTVDELLELAGRRDAVLDEMRALRLTYGAIEGSERLRGLIAALYDTRTANDVLVTHGAIGANALAYQALVEPGDSVVSLVPAYQQHVSIPESLGAVVHPLTLRAEDGFLPDLDALRRLAVPGTRLVSMTNPNNPTGSLIDRAMLDEVVAIARQAGAWLLCDEVYRGIDQEGEGTTASVADVYEKGIAIGGMSKAFSLAGLRLGWIVAPPDFLRAVTLHRDYNTISVGMIDDLFASVALECVDRILARSRTITRTNLATLAHWVDGQPLVSWVRPRSGTTALLRYDLPVASEALCERLLARTGVLLVPGSTFDMEGHLRIGFANGSAVLGQGLARLGAFLREEAASS